MIKYIHITLVILFLLISIVKTILLLLNKTEQLNKFTKAFRFPEVFIYFLFIITGIYLLIQIPEINSWMIIKIIVVFICLPIATIGLKKSSKLLTCCSLVLIIIVFGLSEISNKKRMEAKPEAVNRNDGKWIYSNYCEKCHGYDGKARLGGSAEFTISDINDKALFDIISKGSVMESMPAFESRLNEKQIRAVAEYIKLFRK